MRERVGVRAQENTSSTSPLETPLIILYTRRMQIIDLEQTEEIYTVSRLNQDARFLLEDSFPMIWVEGEVSNFIAHTSGHWYFSLKDSAAQVSCAMFKGSQRKLNFIPKNGSQILFKARVSLYENRGQFQLIGEDMEERGDGKLRRAFEELKKKLAAAGLFAEEHKKPLPTYPQYIGVITSPTGAAIRDILHVLKRRYTCVPVIIYPALVQGNTAAPTIVKAIEIANQRQECDVLILARGGGSLEDLWPFNEECVAHAIYQSKIPIISGVGHEIDFTIADFVADVRAPTPSAAAEIVTPSCVELKQTLHHREQSLTRALRQTFARIKERLNWMQKHLIMQHPKRRLQEQAQRLDFCELKLQSFMKLALSTPQSMLANAAAKLDALSPLATLKRGYAIATDKQHHVLHSIQTVGINDDINVRLSDGELECVVKKIPPSADA